MRRVTSLGTIVYENEDNVHHRLDGPAIEYVSGITRWVINGRSINDYTTFQEVGGLTNEQMLVMKLRYGNKIKDWTK